MNIKRSIIAAALAAALLFSGCGAIAPTTEPTTVPPTTAAPEYEEKDGVTRYFKGEPLNDDGDVRMYAAIEPDAIVDGKYLLALQLFDLQAENYVLSYTLSGDKPSMEEGGGMTGESEQWLVSVDTATGEMMRKIKLPQNVFTDETSSFGYLEQCGSLLWYRRTTDSVMEAVAYDSNLTEVKRFTTIPEVNDSGYFSPDGESYYTVYNSQLQRIATDGSSVCSEIIEPKKSFAFTNLVSLLPGTDGKLYAMVNGMAGNLRDYCAVMDVQTGEFVYLSDSQDVWLGADRDLVSWSDFNEDGVGRYNFCYGQTPYSFSYPLMSDQSVYYNVLGNGRVLFNYSEDSGNKGTDFMLELYDVSDGTLLARTTFSALEPYSGVSSVSVQGDTVMFVLRGGSFGKQAVCVWDYKDAEKTPAIGLTVEPLTVPDNLVPDIPDEYDPSSLHAGDCLPELSEQRARADELGEKYGVDIYLSEQCAGVYGGYAVFPLNNGNQVTEALTALETQLARYPDGFFEQMDSDWTSGVDIYLASTLKGVDDGVLGYAGGFQMDYNGGYAVVIDSNNADDLAKTFNHEMYHAIEMKGDSTLGVSIDEARWNAMNPDGFTYTDDYSTYETGEFNYDYMYSFDTPDGYFIDSYCMVYGKEDRARMFEYGMLSGWIDWSNAPHLREKLSYLSEYIRANFDTTGWGELPWEEPLK